MLPCKNRAHVLSDCKLTLVCNQGRTETSEVWCTHANSFKQKIFRKYAVTNGVRAQFRPALLKTHRVLWKLSQRGTVIKLYFQETMASHLMHH